MKTIVTVEVDDFPAFEALRCVAMSIEKGRPLSGRYWTATITEADAAAVSAVGAGSREGEGHRPYMRQPDPLSSRRECSACDWYVYTHTDAEAMPYFCAHLADHVAAATGEAAPAQASDLENDIQVWFSKAGETLPNRILLAILMDMARRIEGS